MGRAKEITDDALLDGLVRVFQAYGYEGASVKLLAEATGLGRASLYHRFPGGKEEMALAALGRVDAVFGGYVLAPLGEAGEPAARVRRMSDRMLEFYDMGRKSCLLDTLSMGGEEALQRSIKDSFAALHEALGRIAHEAGASPAAARKRAERAVIELQGALVWARASGDTEPFERVMKSLPYQLTVSGSG